MGRESSTDVGDLAGRAPRCRGRHRRADQPRPHRRSLVAARARRCRSPAAKSPFDIDALATTPRLGAAPGSPPPALLVAPLATTLASRLLRGPSGARTSPCGSARRRRAGEPALAAPGLKTTRWRAAAAGRTGAQQSWSLNLTSAIGAVPGTEPAPGAAARARSPAGRHPDVAAGQPAARPLRRGDVQPQPASGRASRPGTGWLARRPWSTRWRWRSCPRPPSPAIAASLRQRRATLDTLDASGRMARLIASPLEVAAPRMRSVRRTLRTASGGWKRLGGGREAIEQAGDRKSHDSAYITSPSDAAAQIARP